MDNYRGKYHTVSGKSLDYLARSTHTAEHLRDTKFGYNYQNMLDILQRRADAGAATASDIAVADKLHRNIKKMSKARRAKVNYDDLKARAESVYQNLVKTNETARDQYTAHIQHAIQKHKNKQAKDEAYAAKAVAYATQAAHTPAGIEQKITSEHPARDIEQPAKGLFARALDYVTNSSVGKYALRTAATIALAASLSCGSKVENPRTEHVNYQPPAQHQVADVMSLKAPVTEQPVQQPILEAKKQPLQPLIEPAALPTAPVLTKAEPTIEPPVQHVAPVAPKQNTPLYSPLVADESSSLRAILTGDGYFDNDTSRYSGTAKGLFSLSDEIDLQVYGNAFTQNDDFDDVAVRTTGERIWGGVSGRKDNLFGELNVGYENRDSTIKPETGSDFTFGNKSPFLNAKLGIGDVDNDGFGVDNRSSFLLGQVTKHWGNSTGDIDDGEYEALRAQLRSRLMLNDDFSLELGGTYFTEKHEDFLDQKNWGASAGVRWHLGDEECKAYAEALLNYQRTTGEIMGNKSEDIKWGPQLGIGYRLLEGPVTIDAAINGGYLFSKEDENEWFVAPSLTLWFGTKKK